MDLRSPSIDIVACGYLDKASDWATMTKSPAARARSQLFVDGLDRLIGWYREIPGDDDHYRSLVEKRLIELMHGLWEDLVGADWDSRVCGYEKADKAIVSDAILSPVSTQSESDSSSIHHYSIDVDMASSGSMGLRILPESQMCQLEDSVSSLGDSDSSITSNESDSRTTVNHTNFASLHRELGFAALQRKDWQSALAHFEDAVELSVEKKERDEIHNDMGGVFVEIEEWKEAARCFEYAGSTAHRPLVRVYKKLGRWSDALRHHGLALRAKENDREF